MVWMFFDAFVSYYDKSYGCPNCQTACTALGAFSLFLCYLLPDYTHSAHPANLARPPIRLFDAWFFEVLWLLLVASCY